MARIDNLTNFVTDIANAIKGKKGTTDLIPAQNFDIEINALPSVLETESGTCASEYSGSYPQATVTLGYKPRGVIFVGKVSGYSLIGFHFDADIFPNTPTEISDWYGGYSGFSGSANKFLSLTITDTGFSLRYPISSSSGNYSFSGTYLAIK